MEKRNSNDQVLMLIKWCLVFGVAFAVYFLLPANGIITLELKKFLAITTGTVIVWIFNLLPTFVSGTIMTLLYILLNVAPSSVVLSAWTGWVAWLVLGGMMLSIGFDRTGLMKRIAYFVIRKAGCSYKGIVAGLITSGVVMTILIPNITGRVTLYSALAFGICKALDLKNDTKAGAGIMLAGFLGAIASRYVVLSGDDNLVIALSFVQDTYPVSFVEHLISSAPLSLLWVGIMIIMVLLLFKQDATFAGKEYFDVEAGKLGKIQPKEIKLLVIVVVTLATMILTDIPVGWLFMLAACICFIPGIDVLSGDDLKLVNYPILFFIVAAMSIGSVANTLNVGAIISETLLPMLQQTNRYTLLVFMWFFANAVHFFMTPLAATSAFVPAMVSIAEGLNLSVTGTIYSYIWGLTQLVFPYQWVLFLITFSYGMFDNKTAVKFCATRLALSFVFLVAVMIPYWMMIGFV